nr:Gp49 family protein [Acinetobacter oleivorans]
MTEDVTEQELDAEIGERIARGNAEKHAENKLWELEGYRLFASNF